MIEQVRILRAGPNKHTKQVSARREWVPDVSIITSVYNGDQFIKQFLDDIIRQSIFNKCELIMLNCNSPGYEDAIIRHYAKEHKNIIYKKLDHDPGIYNAWIMGIKMARGRYITNANLDDRKHPQNLEILRDELDNNPSYDIVCGLTKTTPIPNEMWEDVKSNIVWWRDAPNNITVDSLFRKEDGDIVGNNVIHCMPMWRKKLHAKFGYFEESEYGTFSDWAFWLKCLSGGARARKLNQVIGVYLEDPASHGHRNYDYNIVNKIIDEYCIKGRSIGSKMKSVYHIEHHYDRKLNLGQETLKHIYGEHRSGWSYAMSSLVSLHTANGVALDPFIEKKFNWGNSPGDLRNNHSPHNYPWVGFIHNPPNMPWWFQYDQSPHAIFTMESWKQSMLHCKGLFCLSKYHKDWLETKLDVPVCNLYHPTEFPEEKFDLNRYAANQDKKIIQIGWWLRKLNSIYMLPTKKLKRAVLMPNKPYVAELYRKERAVNNLNVDESTAEKISFVPNKLYDSLLASNLVFVDLYDSSANNAVIECIARNTPIVVRRVPAVIEYLGEGYPLYFDYLDDAAAKAENFELVSEAHQYLCDNPIKEKLTREYFLESFAESEIYKSL